MHTPPQKKTTHNPPIPPVQIPHDPKLLALLGPIPVPVDPCELRTAPPPEDYFVGRQHTMDRIWGN